jgi:DHA1 family tetracycline resistance protein-like MFS transporter
VNPLPILFFTLFNSILGLSVLFPILAPLARELHLTVLEAGTFSTGYSLVQFLFSPLWGHRSEKVGRKPILIIGILGYALGFFLFAFFGDLGFRGVLSGLSLYLPMLGARLLGGIFSSATLPTAQAYLADVTGRERRTQGFAVLGAAFGLGVIFGPAIGGALAGLGLLVPVVFSASLAVLNALFVALALPESRPRDRELPPPFSFLDPRILPILVLGLVLSLASVAMEQTVAFYFQHRLHLSPVETSHSVAIALVFYGIVAVFIQGFVVRLLRWPPRTLLIAGIPLAFFGFLLFIFGRSFGLLTLALVLQGAGGALALPGVAGGISLSVEDNEQGPAAGFSSSAQALGRVLGPVLGTGLYEVRPEAPYLFSSLLMILALLYFLSSPKLRGLGRPSPRASNGP